MKNKLALTLIFVLSVSFCYSQKIGFGVEGGVSVSKLRSFWGKNKISYNVGGIGLIPIKKKFSIQLGLSLNRLGAKATTGNFLFGTSDITFVYDYLEMPFLTVFGGKNILFLAGPYVSALISAKIRPEDGDSMDISSSMESTDFGLKLGLRAHFNRKLFMSFLYSRGLIDINIPEQGLKNSCFQLSLGYMFVDRIVKSGSKPRLID